MVNKIRETAADPGLVQDVTDKLQQRVRARLRELHAERGALPGAIAALATEADALVDCICIAQSTAAAGPRGTRSQT